jgi:hypothetical protein
LSTEDLGILLQWHWKYGTSNFANERQRVQNEPAPTSLRLHQQSAGYAAPPALFIDSNYFRITTIHAIGTLLNKVSTTQGDE